MKLVSILGAAIIAVASTAVHAHAEHGHPQHGGIYGEAGTFQAELVLKERQITLHISNHGEPVSTKGAQGKLTVLGKDGKIEVTLQPAANDQLVATLPAKPAKGSKAVASITLAGSKPANIKYTLD